MINKKKTNNNFSCVQFNELIADNGRCEDAQICYEQIDEFWWRIIDERML